jgi:hypothetical protein
MHIALNAFIVFEELHSVKRFYRKNSKQMIIFLQENIFDYNRRLALKMVKANDITLNRVY